MMRQFSVVVANGGTHYLTVYDNVRYSVWWGWRRVLKELPHGN